MQSQDILAQREMLRNKMSHIPNDMVRMLMRLGTLQNVVNHRMNQLCEKFDLTITQVKVLNFLQYYQNHPFREEITARDLEQFFCVSNPTMAGILKRLESKGYISRVKSMSDARNKRIILVKNIDQMWTYFEQQMESLSEKMSTVFSNTELSQFEKLIEELTINMEENMV